MLIVRVDSIIGSSSENTNGLFGSRGPGIKSPRSKNQVTRWGSQFATADSFAKAVSMNDRMINVENRVMGIESKLDVVISLIK